MVVGTGVRVPTPPIRGQPRLPGLGRDPTREDAQRRLDAQHSHLAISPGDHADRVAKRDRQGGRQQGATAAQRLEALRRRVGARAGGASRGASPSADMGPRRVSNQATGGAGDAAPETGNSTQRMPTVGTSEVLKIPLHLLDGGGGQPTLAGAAGDAEPGAAARRVAEEDPPRAQAVVAAARLVAWHSGVAAGFS